MGMKVHLSSQNLEDLNEMAGLAANAPDMETLRIRVNSLFHHAFSSTSTISWCIDPKNRMVEPVFKGIQEQFLAPYRTYFFQQNPFDPGNIGPVAAPSVCMEELIPLPRFHKTEYYNDFLKQQKIHRQMAVYFGNNQGLLGVIGLHRSKQKSFGRDLKALGNLMAGHMAAAFERLRMAEQLKQARDLFQAAADASESGMLVLDQTFCPLFSNRPARDLCKDLSARFTPYKRPNRYGILLPKKLIDTCKRLAHFLAAPTPVPVPPGTNRTFSLGQGRQIVCKIRFSSPAFIITLEEEPRVDRDVWKQAFGLTGRETEVAAGILRGRTNAGIAQALFISEGTVKNHLKHIFQKVGIKNRTALARRLRAGGLFQAGTDPNSPGSVQS